MFVNCNVKVMVVIDFWVEKDIFNDVWNWKRLLYIYKYIFIVRLKKQNIKSNNFQVTKSDGWTLTRQIDLQSLKQFQQPQPGLMISLAAITNMTLKEFVLGY